MTHISYFITLDPIHHEIEIAQLNLLGVESFLEHDHALEAFIESESSGSLAKEIEEYLKEKALPFKKIIHNARAWNTEWESNFKPIGIDHKLFVRADFHDPDPQYAQELVISPKMAFGTGHHETTSMILEWMLGENFEGKRVLDFGCGTGILGILAAKNGAADIHFIDNDILAVENTIENIAMNQLPQMLVALGSFDAIPEQGYDFILANITRNILAEGIGTLSAHLNAKGKLIMSGFLISDLEFMLDRIIQSGLIHTMMMQRGEWICLIAESQ